MSALHARGRSRTRKIDRRLWRTSREVLEWVQVVYRCIFNLDVACVPSSAVAPRYFCPVPALEPHKGAPCACCRRRGRRLLTWQGSRYCLACGEAQFGAAWWDALRPGPWPARAGFTEPRSVVSWANPPWGVDRPDHPGTARWIDRIVEEYAAPEISLGFLLVPAATDTRWWWHAAQHAGVVHDVGRVPYRRPDGSVGPSPPQSSTLFVFGDGARLPAAVAVSPTITLVRSRIVKEPRP